MGADGEWYRRGTEARLAPLLCLLFAHSMIKGACDGEMGAVGERCRWMGEDEGYRS